MREHECFIRYTDSVTAMISFVNFNDFLVLLVICCGPTLAVFTNAKYTSRSFYLCMHIMYCCTHYVARTWTINRTRAFPYFGGCASMILLEVDEAPLNSGNEIGPPNKIVFQRANHKQ